MLAMTSDKLYKICMIYNNNDCANKCPEGKKLVFDVNNKNICKDSITCSNCILKPNDIYGYMRFIYIYFKWKKRMWFM